MNSTAVMELGQRLAAAEAGEPRPRVEYAQVYINPEALLMNLVAMPGNHSAVWGIGIAPVVDPMALRVLALPDPRPAAAQAQLWSALTDILLPWAQRCCTLGWPLQIISAERSAWDVLDANAERLVYYQDDGLRPAAEIIRYCSLRDSVPGNQSLIPLAELLSTHLVGIGDPDTEHELNTWLYPQASIQGPIRDSMIWTPPQLDREVLHPAIRTFHEGGSNPDSDAAGLLRKRIESMVHLRHRLLMRGLHIWNRAELPPLQCLTDIGAAEVVHMRDYFDARWSGLRAPGNDNPRIAAEWVREREARLEYWDRSLAWEDHRLFVRATMDGEAISGVIVGCSTGKLVVHSDQNNLRMRPGDRLNIRGDTQDGMTLRDLTITATGTELSFDISETAYIHHLATGTSVEICAPPPVLSDVEGRLMREDRAIRGHLAWPYTGELPPRPAARLCDDPLGTAIALRATTTS